MEKVLDANGNKDLIKDEKILTLLLMRHAHFKKIVIKG
jgi:hypothetical protein